MYVKFKEQKGLDMQSVFYSSSPILIEIDTESAYTVQLNFFDSAEKHLLHKNVTNICNITYHGLA